jgi:hypothetical protein
MCSSSVQRCSRGPDGTSEVNDMLLQAIKADDVAMLRTLIGEGADPDECDENGWTALCWAASRGNSAAVEVLCEAGANLFKCGDDHRTPYKIALAGSHREVARQLRELERASGSDLRKTSSGDNEGRLYCKAYTVAELSRFPQWPTLTGGVSVESDEPVFIHQNYVVTRSIWHDKDLLLTDVTAGWRAFCEQALGFKVPDDLDLIAV